MAFNGVGEAVSSTVHDRLRPSARSESTQNIDTQPATTGRKAGNRKTSFKSRGLTRVPTVRQHRHHPCSRHKTNRSRNNQQAPSRDAYPQRAASTSGYRSRGYEDDEDEYYDYRDRDSRRRRDKSPRRDSRSKSGIRGTIDKNFDKSRDGLTSAGLGALAGGLVGHEVGKGPLATAAGVLLGGLGANAWEARENR